MDFGKILEEAFGYAKAGVFKRADRWLKLILATILLGIPLNGWIVRVYRGATPAPEVDAWGTLFIDGLKLTIIGLIYAIPLIIFSVILPLIIHGTGRATVPVGTVVPISAGEMSSAIGLFLLLLVLYLVYDIIIAILLPIASIRFARTGTFSEAFNFRAILDTIGKIGWLNYVIAIILIGIFIGVPIAILALIVLFAGIAMGHLFIALGVLVVLIIIIAPPLATFQARYMTQVYDSIVPAA
jgi:hypothetical protein